MISDRTRRLLEKDAAFLADDPDAVIMSQTAARDCGRRIRTILEALATQTTRAEAAERKLAEAEDVQPYALELQRALTGLTRGGSEYFVRHGDGFRADIPRCVADVQQRFTDAHRRAVEAIRQRQAAEAKLAEAREVIAPFAKLAPMIAPEVPDCAKAYVSGLTGDYGIEIGDLRRAAAFPSADGDGG